jgi:hypothetical protein
LLLERAAFSHADPKTWPANNKQIYNARMILGYLIMKGPSMRASERIVKNGQFFSGR